MIIHTMTIPDDPDDLPRWLERRLMAPDFGQFVAELLAHFPAAPGAAPPQELLGRWLPVALDKGLGPVPPDELTQLLKHPAALAAFQERIVMDGGEYWDEVQNRSDDLSAAFERGKRSLGRMLSEATPPPTGKAIPKTLLKAKVPSGAAKRPGGRGYKIWAIVSTGIAACLAVVVGFQSIRGPGEPPVMKSKIAWGWGKPGGLATNQSSPKDYLNKLAANAEEWSLHRPSDAAGVGTRIAEFRTGCTQLMHSAYGPLTPADKAWLLEHCREWAKKLDGHQQALDSGADSMAVRAEVDATVREMATTLREKAKQVG